jgi:HlyD family secretion protein
MKRWRTSLVWLIIGGAAAALLVYSFIPEPVAADLAQVTRGALVVTVDEDGKTRVRDKYVVSAPLGGKMQRIALRAGDPVKAGQTILASIVPTEPKLLDDRDRAEIEARVDVAQSALQLAQTKLSRAKVAHEDSVDDAKRMRELFTRQGASEDELQNALTAERIAAVDLRSAEAGVQTAHHEVKLAKAALTRIKPRSPGETDPWRLDVPAPIDGQVFRLFEESAAVVTPGQKLVEVGDPRNLEVEVDVLSADAVQIRRGAMAQLVQWGGTKPLQAQVRVVEPSGFLKISALGVEEQRVNVILDLLDPLEQRRELGDGYRVEARIVIWEADDVLKAPAGAFFRRGADWATFAVIEDKAQLRTVQLGRTNGVETEVLGGLEAGDTLILHPSDKIGAGVRVTPR